MGVRLLELGQVKYLSHVSPKGKVLALPTNNRLDWKGLPEEKHPSLLRKFVNYGQKKFYNIGPWSIESKYLKMKN
jgi:hypothetical protein